VLRRGQSGGRRPGRQGAAAAQIQGGSGTAAGRAPGAAAAGRARPAAALWLCGRARDAERPAPGGRAACRRPARQRAAGQRLAAAGGQRPRRHGARASGGRRAAASCGLQPATRRGSKQPGTRKQQHTTKGLIEHKFHCVIVFDPLN